MDQTTSASSTGTTYVPHAYKGVCSRCSHQTTASRPGVIACKWGGCNGTVNAA